MYRRMMSRPKPATIGMVSIFGKEGTEACGFRKLIAILLDKEFHSIEEA